jgi:amino acid transporter
MSNNNTTKTSPIKLIGLWSLALMITGTITSIRNFASSAKFGPELIFFFIAAGILFLIPVALISTQLSSFFHDEGGIYIWTRRAMGKGWGFMAIWLQWANTMAWYPAMLAFIGGLIAYMINPALAKNSTYLVSVILVVFWSLTFINLFGVKESARFAAVCTFIGLILPLIFILSLGYDWFATGKPLQVHLNWHTVIPHFSSTQSWVSLTSVIASYLGIELACVHIGHIKNAKKTFPRALTMAVMIIIGSMTLGSLTIAMIVPMKTISLITGVMQAFEIFLKAYHLQAIVPYLALMILIGSFGEMINWIISPAKGLYQASADGLISPFWKKTNKYGVAYRILFAQAALVSTVCIAFVVIPNTNNAYWLLINLTTEMYLLMYAILFVAAIILSFHIAKKGRFNILGNKNIMIIVSLIGLIGCGIALVVGFFPPDNLALGNTWHYEMLFIAGLLLLISPGLIKAYRLRIN